MVSRPPLDARLVKAMMKHHLSPRKFRYKSYYYDPVKDSDQEHQIKFKRILKSPRPAKKPMRKYLVLTVIIVFFFWYLNDLGQRGPLEIQLESVQVEDVTPGIAK